MFDWLRSRSVSRPRSRNHVARLDELRRSWRRLVAPLNRALPFLPRVEISELEDAHVVVLDLPGVRKEDIHIRLDGHQSLTISGERRANLTGERRSSYSERRYGPFSRSIELPLSVDGWRMNAVLSDGVLEIRLPRLDAGRNKTRVVPIEVILDHKSVQPEDPRRDRRID
jgi:HSP20 family protein